MKDEEIRKALAAKSNKLDVIGAVSGISENRLKEIVNGAEMTAFERTTLSALS